MSIESGIPDFRSVDGLYNQKYAWPPEEILSRAFFDAQPNATHRKLAELEAAGKLRSVVTQTIERRGRSGCGSSTARSTATTAYPTYLNHSFRMLMSLYYCCGLRKSEAQQLCVRDIDFRSGKITILQSKGNVSRIVVASATLLDELQDYNESYCSESLPTDPFVKSSTGGLFATGTLYDAFHALLKEAGIPKRTDGRFQRLHDIRHTFCVHTLEQMQEKGFDLYTSLPLLCAYLGHKHVKETEYYLHFVEEYHGSVLDKTAVCSPFPYEEGDES